MELTQNSGYQTAPTLEFRVHAADCLPWLHSLESLKGLFSAVKNIEAAGKVPWNFLPQ